MVTGIVDSYIRVHGSGKCSGAAAPAYEYMHGRMLIVVWPVLAGLGPNSASHVQPVAEQGSVTLDGGDARDIAKPTSRPPKVRSHS
jgi:hypothetical protein